MENKVEESPREQNKMAKSRVEILYIMSNKDLKSLMYTGAERAAQRDPRLMGSLEVLEKVEKLEIVEKACGYTAV